MSSKHDGSNGVSPITEEFPSDAELTTPGTEVATESSPAGEAPGQSSAAGPAHEPQTALAFEGEAAATAAENDETSVPMEELIEQYAAPQAIPVEGEIFDGHVVAVTEAGVVVDVGGKFEGLVPAQEFLESGGAISFGPGQTIEVERLHEHRDGYVLLSHTRAHRRRVWEKVERASRENVVLTGKVLERIKGGLVVDIGVRAFLPASQVEMRPVHDLEAWKDREIEVRVLKLNRKRGNVVISRRVILQDQAKAEREAALTQISEGAVITGKVKNVTDYGVFVDLGGVDGLLHVSDLVWGRVKHPHEVVKEGEEIQVQVLKFDKERGRISLGRKQLLPDPWATVPERFATGTHVKGTVVGITDYGAFIQIEPGVEGLVHVSEMTWSRRMKHPSKIVKQGDEVEAVVLEVKSDQRRISLGLKQILPDPWADAAAKYPVGTLVKGRVRSFTDFGAFVEIEDGLEGLIHVSDISWTGRVAHPGEKLKKGETVETRVLRVDSENRRLSLGIKQVNDIWGQWFGEHKVDDLVKGKVVRHADFGVFVELTEGIEGLCHISEIQGRRNKAERGEGPGPGAEKKTHALAAGQEYEFKIVKLDPEKHKISLSYRAAQKQTERKEVEQFRSSSKSSPTATIGDAILAKRQSS